MRPTFGYIVCDYDGEAVLRRCGHDDEAASVRQFELSIKEKMMIKGMIRAAVLAGAATATAWAFKRWLDARTHEANHAHTKEAIRDWENEGGAVSSAQGAVRRLRSNTH